MAAMAGSMIVVVSKGHSAVTPQSSFLPSFLYFLGLYLLLMSNVGQQLLSGVSLN